MTELKELQDDWRPKIDAQLKRDLLSISADKTLAEQLIYAVLNGGKRLRPLLSLAVMRSFDVDITPHLLKLATAVEWIHSYSLVHDDLPAMDNDMMRRGQPSVHAKFGEDVAILVGDALLTGAFQVVAEANELADDSQKVDAKVIVAIVQSLSRFAGADGMVVGQIHDMQNHGHQFAYSVDDLLEKVYLPKTAALLRFATNLGGVLVHQKQPDLVQKETQEDLDAFGLDFGLAFQIQDDLDDFDQDDDETVDSLPHLIGLSAAREKRNAHLEDAKQRLDAIAAREAHFDTTLLESFLKLIGE